MFWFMNMETKTPYRSQNWSNFLTLCAGASSPHIHHGQVGPCHRSDEPKDHQESAEEQFHLTVAAVVTVDWHNAWLPGLINQEFPWVWPTWSAFEEMARRRYITALAPCSVRSQLEDRMCSFQDLGSNMMKTLWNKKNLGIKNVLPPKING